MEFINTYGTAKIAEVVSEICMNHTLLKKIKLRITETASYGHMGRKPCYYQNYFSQWRKNIEVSFYLGKRFY